LTSRTWLGQLTAAAAATASLMFVAPQPAPASATATSALTPASTADSDPEPMIIGGNDATENYPFAARVLTTYEGLDVAKCTGTFVKNRRGRIGVATTAHCVSNLNSGAAMPAATVQVQAGSTRLNQLTTIPATQVLVHPGWDWATGADAVADTAVINLTIPAGLHITAIPIDQWARAARQVRLLGWGKTTYDATEPPAVLQQLDTHLTTRSACAAAGITDGEICVAPAANGGQACFGDSGGPALGHRRNSWVLLGSASRGTDESTCTGPIVYTSAASYAGWTDQALTGKCAPHHPRHVAHGAAKRYWALAR
jgi:secreted trypsin-like serine protease